MKCTRCGNSIKSIFQCNICKQKFCTEDCLIFHSSLYHQSNISSPIMNGSLNTNNSFLINKREYNLNNEISPFLVKGIFNNNEIKYDQFFSLDNYILIYEKEGIPKLVGKGSFGQVYLAENKLNKRLYAIKHMEKEDLIRFFKDLDQIYREIDIQSRSKHPNIIQLYYMKETKETFDLVLEYAKYGTLFDLVVKQKGLPENLSFRFFIQIVNAVRFLHENNIIHRDIKPENILLFDNYVVKLFDFGWSIKCDSKLPGGSFSGTPEYMSPEIINNEDYGKEIDLWMLGILLYELVHGFSPFRPKKQEFEEKELIENIQNHDILFYMPCSDEYKELVFWLLEPDVNKRCTIEDIYNSKFVKKFEIEEYDNNYTDEHNSIEDYENNESNSINSTNKANTSIENFQGNNFIKMNKNLLANRYDNSEDLSDSRKIFQSQNNNIEFSDENLNDGRIIEFTKTKRKRSEKLTNSKFKKFNLNLNNNLNENSFNGPKNNKRNKNKNQEIKYKKIVKLNTDLNNANKKKIIYQNNVLTYPSGENDKNKNEDNKSNLHIIPSNKYTNNSNIDKNNNFSDKEGQIINISEDNVNGKNKAITNYIFNNKEISTSKDINNIMKDNLEINLLESNQALLPKKFCLNQKNQLLSLSLIPNTVDYNSLLNHSTSTEGQIILQKEKNVKISFNNLNKGFIYQPINENNSKLLNNMSQNIKEFPFDHFTCNSSLNIHIQKTIFNNKMIKHKRQKPIKKSEEEKYSEVKDKEPNDNMRRKIKKIKNEVPLDNLKKESQEIKETQETNEIKPADNHKKLKMMENNRNNRNTNSNSNNSDIKTISSTTNEKENKSKNKINPISETISKKIIENIKAVEKQKNLRNKDTRYTNDFISQKRKKSVDIYKSNIFKSAKGKKALDQKKRLTIMNNNEKDNKNKINLFTDNPTKNEIIEEEHLFLNKLNNKNNSFVLKNNKIKTFLQDKSKILHNKNERNRNINNNNKNLRDTKTKSVNKKRDFKFIKENVEFKSIKSTKDIIKNNNELGKIKEIKQVKGNINIKPIDIKGKNEKKKITKIENIEKIIVTNEKNNSKNNKNDNKKSNNADKKENQIKKISIKDTKSEKSQNVPKLIIQDGEINKEVKQKKKDSNANKKINLITDIIVNADKTKTNENRKIITEKNANNEIIKTDENNNTKEKKGINNYKIISENNENILEENKENLKNNNNKNVIFEKEIIENKFDNFQIKEVYRYKENIQSKSSNHNLKSDKKSEQDLNKKTISDINEYIIDENIRFTQAVKTKEKVILTSSIKKERKTTNNDNQSKTKKFSNIKIENKGLKLCLDNISQKLTESPYKENRTSRQNHESNNIPEFQKTLNLNTINKNTNEKKSSKIYPKKVGIDDNSSNSSIYEYDKPQNDDENDIMSNSNNEKKRNLSDIETKISNNSKEFFPNIEKVKALSDINFDKNKIVTNKSKSPSIRNLTNKIEKKELELKIDKALKDNNIKNNNINKKGFTKAQKLKKMNKNKTDGLLYKNHKENKINNNKKIKGSKIENLKQGKKNNSEKIIKVGNEINNNINIDSKQNIKKRYKKSLTGTIKDEKEKSEKGNDSESCIIEGDSEYGDSEAFKL